MVGVRRETIGKLENGKYNPSLKLVVDIAKVFLEKQWNSLIKASYAFLDASFIL